jgi:hypothetical protein
MLHVACVTIVTAYEPCDEIRYAPWLVGALPMLNSYRVIRAPDTLLRVSYVSLPFIQASTIQLASPPAPPLEASTRSVGVGFGQHFQIM